MYKYILEQAGNINWMAVFSLTTFVFVFVTSVILILRKDKDFTQRMAHMPLEDNFQTSEMPSQHEK